MARPADQLIVWASPVAAGLSHETNSQDELGISLGLSPACVRVFVCVHAGPVPVAVMLFTSYTFFGLL